LSAKPAASAALTLTSGRISVGTDSRRRDALALM
jgi:hypothetical protein